MRPQVLVLNLLALLGLCGRPESGFGLELRVGKAWFEKGDYLLEPGAEIVLENARHQSLRLELSGRRFGRFTETSGILSVNFPFTVLPWKSVYTSYGISLLDQYTAYNSPSGKDESEHSINLGVNLGLGWRVIETGQWSADLEWNSHIFAAGLAFIYLTTARKTNFTLAVGYEL